MEFFYFFAILPDILFPFSEAAPHWWRFVVHFIGSFSLVFVLWCITPHLPKKIVLSLAVLAIIFFAVQEFYIHPTLFEQSAVKGVIDFLTWTIPLVVYSAALERFSITLKT